MLVTARALLVLIAGFVASSTQACDDETPDTSSSGSSSGTSSSTSSSGSGSAAATLPDACSLITPAEVESLLGAPTTGEPVTATSDGGDVRRCTWKRSYSPELRTDELVISIAQAAAYAASGPTALVGASPFAIGDEGQVLDQPRGVQAAWKKGALSASYRYSISGLFKDDFEPLRTRAKELAQAANGRM